MKRHYKLYRRAGTYYREEVGTRKRVSLQTKDRAEAERLVAAANEAANTGVLNETLASAYLTGVDPKLATRTWTDAVDAYCATGTQGDQTAERKRRAFKTSTFDPLRDKPIMMTTAEDFLQVLEKMKVSHVYHLKRLQNLAVSMGWRPTVVLAPAFWPKRKAKPKRAITEAEHKKILAQEKNEETHAYYRMCWFLGGAQSDMANLKAEDFDLEDGRVSYYRAKTKTLCTMELGEALLELLEELPDKGPLFPRIIKGDYRYRSAEFARRCRLAGIRGVSLHSYRYSWAERAAEAGIEERFAMSALGHGSKAIHRAYAKRAKVVCPALD